MKTYKKLLLVGLVSALGVVGFNLAAPQKTSAAELSDAVACWQSLRFTDMANMDCDTSDAGTDPDITFTDRNPTDGDRNYRPNSAFFCNPGNVNAPSFSLDTREWGINANDQLSVANSGNAVTLRMNIGYSPASTTGCTRYGNPDNGADGGRDVTLSGDRSARLRFYFQFAGDPIVQLDGLNGGALNNQYSLISRIGDPPGPGGLYRLGYADGDMQRCTSTPSVIDDPVLVIIVQTNGPVNSALGTRYLLFESASGMPRGSPIGDFLFENGVIGCGAAISQPISQGGTREFSILGTPPAFDAAPEPDPTGTGGPTTPTCESNFSSVFAFFMCPALREADDAAQGLFAFVERELCINTGNVSSTGNPPCEDEKNIFTDDIERIWNAFRIIASALLVIIMLVMVISQAFSIGPVDAYTLRKLLPRLVAAVILIQISWIMLKWFVDLSNDLGTGITQIMFAPFGGVQNMQLEDLVGQGVRATTGGGAAQPIFEVFGTLAAVGLAVANLPGLLALAFFAIVSLFMAFFVLILRKMLIILLVVLAPIALILWILPGTDRYWQFWKDNFTKLLLMFPLIMAMIAAGRIFAYIAAQTATMFTPKLGVASVGPIAVPNFADIEGFVGLVMVIVAFFAPYLLIYKTFSWGGSLLGAGSRALTQSNVARDFQKKGSDAARGYTERTVTGRAAKKYDPQKGLASRTAYSILGGRVIPTKYRRAVLTQRGDEWAKMRNAESDSYVGRTYEKALEGGYDKYDMDAETGQFQQIRRNANGKMTTADGEVTEDKKKALLKTGVSREEATSVRLKGVEAGKQALIDLAGREGSDIDNRAAQAAHKLLSDTHSEIETQNSRIQTGPNTGKRHTEVASYRSTLESSPQHYSTYASRRPDQAPDVIESAQKEVGMSYEDAYKIADPGQRAEKIKQLHTERLRTTLERLTPEGLSGAHFGIFQDLEKVGDRVVEIKDAEGKKVAKTLSQHFQDTLVNFEANGGVVGANAVGSLRGGKERYVNAALPEGVTLTDITSTANAARRGSSGSGRTRTPAPGATEGELPISHDEPPRIITPDSSDYKSPSSKDIPR